MLSCALCPAAAVLLSAMLASADAPVPVRYPEANFHETLVLRAADGSKLADGEFSQAVEGTLVTARLVLRFADGSLHDDTVVFSQDGQFTVVRDHLVQSGPAFPRALDMSIDAATGRVRVVYSEKDGRPRQVEKVFSLPPDLSNGIVPTLLKNIGPAGPRRTLSLVVATPSPRLVRLEIVSASREPVRVGPAGASRDATHYVLKVRIGGAAGWLAPLVGKQPPDSHVWISSDTPPVYLRSDQPFFLGGSLWRIDATGGEAKEGGPLGR